MTAVLVTGRSGFIGAAVVQRLVKEGHRVRVLDNLWRGSMVRFADVAEDIEFVKTGHSIPIQQTLIKSIRHS